MLHHDQLLEHGGRSGIRDENGLESAMARPRNRWTYEGARDIVELAACYGHALARGHPFVDGNKRTAFLAMAVFLELNGLTLNASDDDVVRVMRAAAAGELDEPGLASWLQAAVA